MRDTPNARRGTDSIVNPTTKAAMPPDGDSERFRMPLKARYVAAISGTIGMDLRAVMLALVFSVVRRLLHSSSSQREAETCHRQLDIK